MAAAGAGPTWPAGVAKSPRATMLRSEARSEIAESAGSGFTKAGRWLRVSSTTDVANEVSSVAPLREATNVTVKLRIPMTSADSSGAKTCSPQFRTTSVPAASSKSTTPATANHQNAVVGCGGTYQLCMYEKVARRRRCTVGGTPPIRKGALLIPFPDPTVLVHYSNAGALSVVDGL